MGLVHDCSRGALVEGRRHVIVAVACVTRDGKKKVARDERPRVDGNAADTERNEPAHARIECRDKFEAGPQVGVGHCAAWPSALRTAL